MSAYSVQSIFTDSLANKKIIKHNLKFPPQYVSCINTLATTSYFKFSLPVPGTDTAVPDIIIPAMDSKVHQMIIAMT